ncbi:hypothetical protein Tco_0995711 [Tanacetum coccineum]
MVKTGLFKAIDSLIPLDEHLATFRGNRYQERDKTKAKPDETEHEIEKSVRIRVQRKIADLDADAEVTLVDEAHGRIDDNLMFDTRVFDEQEVQVEKIVSTAKVTTTSATTTTVDELTLAQTLIEIKAAKPKVVTTAATTTTTAVTRPKARGVVVQEPSEFRTTKSSSQTSRLPQVKDKGKAKMIHLFLYSEVVEGSKSQAKGSKKRTREEFESNNSKKQKIDENVEAEVDDEAEMKKAYGDSS